MVLNYMIYIYINIYICCVVGDPNNHRDAKSGFCFKFWNLSTKLTKENNNNNNNLFKHDHFISLVLKFLDLGRFNLLILKII